MDASGWMRRSERSIPQLFGLCKVIPEDFWFLCGSCSGWGRVKLKERVSASNKEKRGAIALAAVFSLDQLERAAQHTSWRLSGGRAFQEVRIDLPGTMTVARHRCHEWDCDQSRRDFLRIKDRLSLS
jgi:hypothetical protein